MVIGAVDFDLEIPGAQSLKDKRMVLRSLKERLRGKFNVSVAETGDHDLWQAAQITAVMVGSDRQFVNEALSKLVTLVENDRDAVLADYRLTFL